MRTVDVGALLDEGHWSGCQKLLVLTTALTIVLDGVDNQLVSVAIPALMREWSLPCGAFANIVASGLVGMMLGGAIAGVVGGRLGGAVTCAPAEAHDFETEAHDGTGRPVFPRP